MQQMNSIKDDNLISHFSDVRHTVKNHMSVVLAFAQLLQIELSKKNPDPKLAIEYLEKVDKRAKQTVEEIDKDLSEQKAIELG